MESTNYQPNWEVQVSRLTNELGSCGSIVQLFVAGELELQKKILECDSRLNSSKDILVEEDIILQFKTQAYTFELGNSGVRNVLAGCT
jgi:hypothetical protein